MARDKVAFRCQECGYIAYRWLGRCPDCGAWNSLIEERQEAQAPRRAAPVSTVRPEPITAITSEDIRRMGTGSAELDRVLGGGIVPASLVLVGGDPGIGKSTLLLSLAASLARERGVVLYVSGEESARQIRLRAERLGAVTERLLLLPETDLNRVQEAVREVGPFLLVIDSIQTMSLSTSSSPPGSIAQIRECTAALLDLAKGHGVSTFIAGHVTKQGALAGPRLLEHMVDTVLYFEGEGKSAYRILRAVKNRFGSTNEIAVFTMEQSGLKEVTNPSQLFLSDRTKPVPGAVVVATTQGTRPLLVEVQALVSPAAGGPPRRVGRGVDLSRLLTLLAVLEKRAGLPLATFDVYANVAGGVRLDDPAADLGLALAIASSFWNRAPLRTCVAAGEIGLTGEVLSVAHLRARLKESVSLGFHQILVPQRQAKSMPAESKSVILGVESVSQALDIALPR
ncbi:MAG TPA: DNA repair protein RadA [Firmicutes bacterium]|nr:DNA repair protein RadA [Bacillota bacterium]